MKARLKIPLSFLVVLTLVTAQSTPLAVRVTHASAGASGVPVSRGMFGVNTFAWDSQILSAGAQKALVNLGVGMQQFPNSVNWNWQTNSAVANPNQPSNPGKSPVSIQDWSKILQRTHEAGLYIFNYDQAPGWHGGGTSQDAAALAQYIQQNRVPVTAIVIGDEEYGAWDFNNNLHNNKSAARYAENVVGIAKAIRAILPSVKIGVSFEDSSTQDGLIWDSTVLRTDAPYINFVSVHQYLEPTSVNASQLLSQIPSSIQTAMSTAFQQIYANLPAPQASKISVWVTEFNPEQNAVPLSLTPAYGAAMIESFAAFAAAGASHLFVWSLDWPNPSTDAGTWGLIADGNLGSFAKNQFYPSGQAVAQFMQAVGDGGTLRAWSGSNGFAATVYGSVSHSFFINPTNTTQTYTYNVNDTITVSPDSYAETSSAINSVSGMSTYSLPPNSFSGENSAMPTLTSFAPLSVGVDRNSAHTAASARPNGSSAPNAAGASGGAGVPSGSLSNPPAAGTNPQTIYPGEDVTLTGADFGTTPGYVSLRQGPLSFGQSTLKTVSWGAPGNWLTDRVLSWSPTSVTFQVPNNTPAPDGHYYGQPELNRPIEIRVVTSQQSISDAIRPTVVPTPAPQILTQESKPVYPGEWLTLQGAHFGPQPGYIQLQQGGVSWGAPGNSYSVALYRWSSDSITFQVPNGAGNSGQPLSQGTASLTLVNSDGAASASETLHVTPYGADITSAAPAAARPGSQVKIEGSGFGNRRGRLQITQNGTSWGAPGNAYSVHIISWSDHSIVFDVPDGHTNSGAGMSPGPAQVRVMTANEATSPFTGIQISG